MPVHRGHMYLIDYARQRVAHLTVLVCSLAREPIPGRLRYRWVRDLFPDVDVRHFAEEVPQYPHEHSDFWDIWRDVVRRHVPSGPDYVFTSETYGDRLAQGLGAQHVCVDLGRERFPVSGTAVRADPEAYRGFLPLAVQAYFESLATDAHE